MNEITQIYSCRKVDRRLHVFAVTVPLRPKRDSAIFPALLLGIHTRFPDTSFSRLHRDY